MKSVDAVREGGVIAFITSQGVADAERNRPVREWLMQRCDIISAPEQSLLRIRRNRGRKRPARATKENRTASTLRAAKTLYRDAQALERNFREQYLPFVGSRRADLGARCNESLRTAGHGFHTRRKCSGHCLRSGADACGRLSRIPRSVSIPETSAGRGTGYPTST